MRTIYLDMDGVMANFDAIAQPLFGDRGNSITDDYIGEPEWAWLAETKPHFFSELPVCAGALEFGQYLRVALKDEFRIEFLTAIPRSAFKYATVDKVKWALRYFPDFDVCIGPYAKDKKNFARVGDILIDDRLDNIEEWAVRGGQGIFHLSNSRFVPTLDALQDAIMVTRPGIWKDGKRAVRAAK